MQEKETDTVPFCGVSPGDHLRAWPFVWSPSSHRQPQDGRPSSTLTVRRPKHRMYPDVGPLPRITHRFALTNPPFTTPSNGSLSTVTMTPRDSRPGARLLAEG
ncbi:hypothetical protein HHI36_004069 [Cryptolaemus montrouzieri]|uniref:Uncharacterized protein n=1 Tax=Cryptolaemus montrouzieri TaxID=559131 RepID=A0ABD2NQC2_9CUCU